MRRYIEHMQSTREPHQRRMHAMHVAGGVTLALFAIWVGTLSIRLSGGSGDSVAQSDSGSLAAAAAQVQTDSGPHLEVSTTSVLQN